MRRIESRNKEKKMPLNEITFRIHQQNLLGFYTFILINRLTHKYKIFDKLTLFIVAHL